MGTEQSIQNTELSDNDNPYNIRYFKFKEIKENEFESSASNSQQTTNTKVDDSEKVTKTVEGSCDFCGGTFPDLITHLRVHYYEKPFLCRACNMSFKTEEELNGHKNSCDEKKRSLIPCSVCMNPNCSDHEHSKNAPAQPVQIIIQTQLQSQPLILTTTPTTIPGLALVQTQTQLQSSSQTTPSTQTQTQTKPKPQPQPQAPTKLLSNTQTQLPVKSYTCFACKRNFTMYKQWKAHSNYCTSNSRFHKCPTCKKCFGLLIMSKLHQIHCKKALMDDYSCDHCSEKFDNKPDLVTHVLQKHKETIQITLESLLEESKQLKKDADLLKKNQKPVASESILKKNLLAKKQQQTQ